LDNLTYHEGYEGNGFLAHFLESLSLDDRSMVGWVGMRGLDEAGNGR
jgi:hypothetical protein